MNRALIILMIELLAVCAGAATRYDGDGQLTDLGEARRWLINQRRFAPERGADGLGITNTTSGGTPNYDVCEDITSFPNSFGTNAAAWAPWTRSLRPLAPNAKMTQASQKHALDMLGTNVLSATSPTGNYYPLNSTMIQRHLAEGYTNQIFGYFLNIGYLSGGTFSNAMLTLEPIWFRDVGTAQRVNRRGQLNDTAYEIGIGMASNATAPKYTCTDFGRTGSNIFFTCSIFSDTNTNKIYNAGEGVSGIEVRLFQNTNEAPWYDVSGSAGGFAVPLWGLSTGQQVTVKLANTNASTASFHIAYDYGRNGRLVLTSGEHRVIGTFLHAATNLNAGFRNLIPWTQPANIAIETNGTSVTFPTWEGIPYRIESFDPLSSTQWTAIVNGTGITTGQTLSATDTTSGTSTARLYRITFERDY